MMGIESEDVQTVIEIIKRHVPHERVAAFGSRVKGNAKKFSDLDLAVMTDQPLDFSVLLDMKHDFSESRLPFRVDVLDWASTNKEFQDHIRDQLVEIYQPPAS